MKGAALSDIHLGFRSFPATANGRNTREQDVERAWFDAVDQIAEAGVQVVTIAGDVFHHPRVSDFAKQAFLSGIRVLVDRGIYVIILQGNHDAGRTSEVLTPIALGEVLDRSGLLYVVTERERIRLQVPRKWIVTGDYTVIDEEAGYDLLSFACFPFEARASEETYKLEPDPDADVNILVMHAAVHGDSEGDALPYFYGGAGALDVGREAERWDVIHCGDFHEFRRLHPTRLAFYPGSIERTSSNIWQETAPKGWVLYDTDDGTMEFRKVDTREMGDLVMESAEGPQPHTAEGVNNVLEALLEQGDHHGTILRLKVDDFPREEKQHINWALVRQIKGECTHFYLDLRYAKPEIADLGDRREREHALSLADEAVAFFAHDSPEVRDLALSYLDVEADVEDVEEEVAAA